MSKKHVRAKSSENNKKVAKERILELFKQAKLKFKGNKSLANRYVGLARKIAMKYRLSIPKDLRRKFCKKCYKYLVPGVNCRIRIQKGKRVLLCMECKYISRIHFKN
jgi:ribonuclease P protein subunit RPR2|tara:strand:+ start:5059 stop:5379 length:321 start_codon:yes stop_codon:yes gene_type:complete